MTLKAPVGESSSGHNYVMPQYHYQAAHDCKEAQKYLRELYDDPMTKHYGVGSEVAEGYLRQHIKKCKKCEWATVEANTP